MPARKAPRRHSTPAVPPASDWRTSDADDLAKRQLRAREERFRINGLGTCKSVEAMLLQAASRTASPRIDIVPAEASGILAGKPPLYDSPFEQRGIS